MCCLFLALGQLFIQELPLYYDAKALVSMILQKFFDKVLVCGKAIYGVRLEGLATSKLKSGISFKKVMRLYVGSTCLVV